MSSKVFQDIQAQLPQRIGQQAKTYRYVSTDPTVRMMDEQAFIRATWRTLVAARVTPFYLTGVLYYEHGSAAAGGNDW